MQNIVLCGSSGTGKTTILNELRNDPRFSEYHIVTEIVRDLVKTQGIKINESGEASTQHLLFGTYKDIFNNPQNYPFISDRSLIDVISYTATNFIRNIEHDSALASSLADELELEFDYLKEFAQNRKDITWIYFPIEFATQPDGVRSLDEHYRAQVDKNMRTYLNLFIRDYLTVSGTVKERITQIIDYLGTR